MRRRKKIILKLSFEKSSGRKRCGGDGARPKQKRQRGRERGKELEKTDSKQ